MGLGMAAKNWQNDFELIYRFDEHWNSSIINKQIQISST